MKFVLSAVPSLKRRVHGGEGQARFYYAWSRHLHCNKRSAAQSTPLCGYSTIDSLQPGLLIKMKHGQIAIESLRDLFGEMAQRISHTLA
jgi:hypothetical protein